MDAYRAGEVAAMEVLTSLGRDACFSALKYAEKLGDEELIDFSRRLVAVPPSIETNLFELREASVDARVKEARTVVPALASEPLVRATGSFALFDPLQTKRFLARGGRARKEPDAQHKGTLAVFGLSVSHEVTVRILQGEGPEGVSGVEQRLRVGSGVVAAGAPESSDGPRLGSVRLDPHRTQLDEALDKGMAELRALNPGVYRLVAIHPDPRTLAVYIRPDDTPEVSLAKDPWQIPILQKA